jgi:L,D-peptidoglycan transpeptidase YkuD (ErfK/YbiS/YcfS/YnhG family)
MDIRVYPNSQLEFAGKSYNCSLGSGGVVVADAKREGDGATPSGNWPIRKVWYRPDRINLPALNLPTQAIEPDDGWCDGPDDPSYNQHVKLPYPASHEILWREDNIYDIIVELGFNDDPAVPGKGSAIFMHVARPGYSPTLGCIGLAQDDLLAILASANLSTKVVVANHPKV